MHWHVDRYLLSSTALTRLGARLGLAAGFVVLGAASPIGEARALPQDGRVVGGSATIVQVSPSQLDVDQSSSRAVIDWRSFSIGTGETTRFIQPGADSIAFNRVTGADPSQIAGHLQANGQVVLVNPNGVLFSKSAQVNVGGLVASTAGITTQNAMQGRLVFDQAGNANASVNNAGTITARDGGLVALVAPSVANSGVIRAKLGHIALSSGDKWTLDLYGDRLVSFDVTDQVNGSVSNTGALQAGTIEVTANTAKGIVGNAINMGGIVEATQVHEAGGTIVLDGGDNGDVAVSGTLKANGSTGGTIAITGHDVALTGAMLDASGASGGGTIKVGGGSLGSGTLRHAQSVTVDASSVLVADALLAGNGGGITVWSDGATGFYGSASAKGGAQAGNGGTIETSGHALIADPALIDTSAAHGATGNWLLDPFDLSINATGASAISTALATSNVTVQTTAATSGMSSTSGYGSAVSGTGGNISVNSAISWSSANSLTLSAYNSILVNANITDTGAGNVVLRADNTGLDASGLGGAGSGTIVNSATISTGGAVSLYYDPASYASPTTFSGITAGGGKTAYMLVNSTSDLNNVATNLSGTYALGNNITFASGTTFAGIANNGGATAFSGVFDGNGGIGSTYSISGATITGGASVTDFGFFGDNTGTIRNVTLVNEYLSVGTYATDAGGLVGINYGTVSGDAVSGTVTNSAANHYNIGGVVGATETGSKVVGDTFSGTLSVTASTSDSGIVGGVDGGVVSGSTFTGNVIVAGDATDAGGIAGYNGGTVIGNTSTGNVTVGTASSNIGGVVGYNSSGGSVLGNLWGGSLTAGANVTGVGGLLGVNTGFVSGGTVLSTAYLTAAAGTSGGNIGAYIGQSTNNGTVTGGTAAGTLVAGAGYGAVGGLIGDLYAGTLIGGYSTVQVNVSGSNNVGGLIGNNNTGTVVGGTYAGTVVAAAATNVGGFVGSNGGVLQGGTASGLVSVAGVSNYVGGFAGINSGTISGVSQTASVSGGAGVQHAGVFIGANNSGGTVVNDSASGSITLGANAAYSGGFMGANDGGYASGVTFSGTVIVGSGSTDIGGLAGVVNTGTVLNGTVGVLATLSAGSAASNIGGYIGLVANSSTVTSGVQAGAVSVAGGSGIGGGIGLNTSAATISGLVVGGNVTAGSGSSNVGGLVGSDNSGLLQLSYNTGAVFASASTAVGGVAGYNATTINQAYSTGYIGGMGNVSVGGAIGQNSSGTYNSVYWDTSTSGLTTSAAGTGQTTSQLQAGLPTGFSTASWGIVTGASYPYLLSQYATPPQVISGTATGAGVAGDKVGVIVGGTVTNGRGAVGANGYYDVLLPAGSYANGSDILAYLGNMLGNGLRISAGGNEAAVNIASGAVTETSDGAALTTSALTTALGGLSNPDILYTVSGGTATFGSGTNYVMQAGALNISVNSAVVVPGTWTLSSTGVVTQSVAITAGTLNLQGTGEAYNFTNPANSVTTLSGNTGSVDVWDGTSASVSALTTTGNVTVADTSSIALAGALSAGGNVVLRADDAGTDDAGTVTTSGGTLSAAGSVSVYYDPAGGYGTPGSFVNITAGAGPAGGTAYMLVNSVADLGNVRNNLSGTYALGTNIAGVGSFAGIGGSATAFSGLFDGNGGLGANYSISGATVTGSSYVGLFGNNSGTIRNVTVSGEAVSSASGGSYVGGLVGYNQGTISNDAVSGAISAGTNSQDVGGLVGYATGAGSLITGSMMLAGGTLSAPGGTNVGGLVGYNDAGSTISGGTALEVVSANATVGGFVGANAGVITGVSAGNSVNVAYRIGGGLAGANTGSILNSTASSTVSGSYDLGGVAGYNSGTISGDTASGTVIGASASNNVGGLVGYAGGTVTASNASESITVGSGSTDVGGLIGFLYPARVVSGGTFSGTISAGNVSTAIGGLVGYDNGGTVSGGTVSGAVSAGSGSQEVGGLVGYSGYGTGTSVTSTISGGTVLATAVLSTSGSTGVGGLVGYNDLGSTIGGGTALEAVSGITNIGGDAGTNYGVVTGVTATNNVSGSFSVGGLVGGNNGTIAADVVSSGTVLDASSAGFQVGGLVGNNYGLISASSANNTVSVGAGVTYIGGLLGANVGTVVASTASGSVIAGSGSSDIGGLIGWNRNSVSSSLFSGNLQAGLSATTGVASSFVGGLVGYNTGTVGLGNIVSGAVSAGSNSTDVGGLVGYSGYGTGTSVTSTISGTVLATAVLSTPGGNYVGGLVGYNDLASTISGGTASEGVSSQKNVGGLVGYNAGTITGVTGSNNVTGVSNTGGIAGTNTGVISSSNFTGTASGATSTGGLVGANAGSVLTASVTGSVLGSVAFTGGVVGYENYSSTLSAGTFAGTVIAAAGSNATGGLIGWDHGNVTGGSVSGVVSAGSGSTAVGGLIGEVSAGGAVASGNFSGTLLVTSAGTAIGGLVGYNDGNTISGGAVSGAISAGSNSQQVGGLVGYSGYGAGMSVTSKVTGGTVLGATLSTPGGTGVGGLVGYNDLASTISGGTAAEAVSATATVGGFVGFNAGVITGVSWVGNAVTGTSYVGGVAGSSSGTISGVTITGLQVTGIGSYNPTAYLGGVVGYSSGLLSGITSSGNVTETGSTDQYIGGVAGYNGGTATNISVTGGVVSSSYDTSVGGVVGKTNVTLAGVSAANTVMAGGGAYIGGIAGVASGNVSGVSFSGAISIASATYGTSQIGGLVGQLLYGTLTAGIASGAITVGSNSHNVGGLVGWNDIGTVLGGTASDVISAVSATVNVGGIAGYESSGNISGSTFAGTILAGTTTTSGAAVQNLGGLVGYNVGGLITAGTVSGQITAGAGSIYVGGLVGYETGGTVGGGTVSGAISVGSGGNDVGGLVGYSGYGTGTSVTSTISGGTVLGGVALSTPGGTAVGGLVGYNDLGGTISGGTALEAVSGSSAVGGLAGYNAGLVAGVSVSNSVVGSPSSTAVGGIVGYNAGTLTAGTSTGSVSVGTGSFAVGGLAGLNATGGVVAGDSGTGAVTAGFGSTYVHGASQIGCDETAGCAGTPGQQVITVTAAPVTTTYGTAGGALSYTASGTLESGDTYGAILSGSVYSAEGTSAGSYAIGQGSVALVSPYATLDYAIDYVGANYTVNKATVTVTPTGSQVYGGSNIGVSYGYIGLVNGDGTAAVTGIGYSTPVTTASNVGSYGVTATGGTASNYTVVDGTGAYSVTPATVTVTPTGTQVYGGGNAAVSYAYTGLVNGNGTGVVTGIGYSTPVTTASNVGSYGVTATGGTASNYTVVDGTGAYSVTPATVTVTPTGTQVYGGSNAAVSYAYTGLVNGNGTGVVSGIGYATPVTTASNVGSYGVTATGGTASNYTVVDGTGSYSVTPATVTVTPTGTQVYGGGNAAVSYGYIGLVNGDGTAAVTGIGYSTPVTTASNVGSYGVTATGGTASNYTVVDGTGSYSVTPATVTVTPTGTQVYGGSNVGVSYAYVGLVNGNGTGVVTGIGYATPVTTASNVGSYGVTATGGAASNYTVVDGTGAYSVTPATVTVTPTGSQVYGGGNAGVSYAYTGLVNGDGTGVVTGIGYSTPVTTASNVGSYGVTATGGTASNYTVVDGTGSYSVTPATVTVTPTGTQVYGGSNVGVSYAYVGLVNGNGTGVVTGIGYATPVTTASNVGSYGVTATGGTASNYTVVDGTGSYSVTPATVTVTPTGTQVYGGGNAAVSYGYIGLVNGNGTGVVTGIGYSTPVTTASNVGSYGVTATGGAASNYTVVDGTGAYSVTPATVTVTPTGSQVYGGSNIGVSYGYIGLVNGDGTAAVTGIGYSTPVTTASNVGSYGVTATGGTASNYTVVDGTGSYSVTPATVTVTPTGTQVYGGGNAAVSYAYIGLVNGNGTGVVSGIGYATPVTTASNVGSYGVTATGGTASNYTVVDGTGSYSVTPATVTVTPTGTQVYGGGNAAVSYAYTGLVNGNGTGVVTGIGYSTPVTTASNVGSYGVTATGGTASNYTVVDGTGSYSVTPATVTVTPTGSQVYGGGNAGVSYAYTGLVNGNGTGVVTGIGYSTPVTTASNVGSYGVTATGGTASNYTVVDGTGAYSVTPATVTVTPTGTQVYGGSGVGVSYAYTGLVNGNGTGVVTGIGYSTPVTTASNVGSYGVTATGGTASNYTVVDGTGSYSVTPATVTVTPTGTQVYGGSNVGVSYAYVGLVNGNGTGVVTGIGYATPVTTASNVGSYGVTATGGTASNYTVVDGTGSYSVTPATVTVTPTGTQVYGGGNAAVSYGYIGLVNGNGTGVVTGIGYSTPVTTASNVGSYGVTATGGAASNYTVVDGTGAYSVTPATVTVTPTGTQVYGDGNAAVSYGYIGLVNGDGTAAVTGIGYSTPVTTASNVGSYGVTATGGTASNYTVVDGTGSYSVTPATVTVTPTGTQVYGGSNAAVSYAYTGLVNGNGTGVVTGIGYSTPVTTASNVGSYGVTATGGTASNYTVVDGTGSYSVTPATVTVTPTGTQVYGGGNVAVSYGYTGLVNGDGTGVVTGIGYATPVTTASNVGSYGVTATGGTASNYTVVDGTGSYSVTPATVTVTPTGTQVYGGGNVAVSYGYTGLVNGDGTGVVTGIGYSTPVTTASNVGSYGVTATGGTASNYTVVDGTGSYSVTPATVTVTPTGSQVYGGSGVGVSYAYTGLVNSDGTGVVTGIGYATPVTTASNVGSYGVTATGGAASNYTVVDGTGAYSVTPATVTVTPTGSQVYGGGNAGVSYAYTGLVNGNGTGVVTGIGYATPVTTASNVGSYGVTATGGAASNYNVVDGTGAYSVTPATVTVTPTGTQVYGGSGVGVSYAYTGLVNGNGTGVVTGIGYSTPVTTASNVGSYGVTATGGAASNYNVVDGTGAYSVTPATVTVTPTGTQVYGGSNAGVSYAYTGLVNGNGTGVVSGIGYATPVTTASNVGSYGVTATGGAASNYNVVDGTGSYSVTPATVTVTPTGTQVYGGGNAGVSYAYTGLVNGNGTGVVTGIGYATPVTTASNVGSYGVTATGGTASNYNVVDGTGAYSVTPATVTVTPTGTQVYGGSNAAVSYAYTGLVNGDGTAAVTGIGYATPVTTASNVGSYGVTATGGTASNYNVVDGTGSYSVTPATVTVTPTGSQMYGGGNAAVSYAYTGLVNGNGTGVVTGIGYATPVTTASNVGSYGVTATGGTASNYTVVDGTGSYSVTPATVTVTPTGSQVYGGSNAAVSYAYTGLVNSDGTGVVTGIGYATPVTTASNVGSYGVTATGGTASNYTVVDGTGSYSVTPATVTVTPTGTQVYGGSNVGVSYAYVGLVNGNGTGVVTGIGYSTPVTTASNVGSYGVTATGGAASNYTVVDGTGSYSVTPATVTVTPTGTQVYGGGNAAVSYGYIGLVNGNGTGVVTGIGYSTPVTTASNVGSYGVTATGGAASNYTVVDGTGAYSVTPATVTVTPTGTQVYGGSGVGVSYAYTGLVNGNGTGVVTGVTYFTNASASSPVAGTYAIAATGGTASNYDVVNGVGVYTVTPATVTVTPTGTQVYGGGNAAVSYAYTGLVNGNGTGVVTGIGYSTPVTTASNVGSYGVTVTGGTASNYNVVDGTGAYSVTPATVTVTPTGSQVYGGGNAGVSYAYTGLVNGNGTGVVSGIGYSTPVTTASNVGSYGVTATGGTASNYTVVDGTGSYSVTPATVTVTPTGTQVYGGGNAAVSYAYTGLVNGNGTGVVTGIGYATPVTTASNVGSYGVTATGGAASNYNVVDGTGAYSVTPAALTITASDASRLYGQADPVFSATFSGLVLGQGSSVVTGLGVTANDPANASVGTSWTITASGGSAANYAITYQTGTLSIAKAYLTVAVDDATRVYGSVNPAFAVTYYGLQPGDSVSGITYTTAATHASNVGGYAITASGAMATDYSIVYEAGTLTVTPAPLVITANSASRVYGSANPTLAATYTGLVNNDSSAAVSGLTLGTAATTGSNVGNYAITAANGNDPNYAITYQSGTMTVTPAPLVITANSASRAYGSANAALAATYAGLVNNDSSAVVSGLTLGTAATTGSNVGSYAINVGNGSAANYAITYQNGMMTVIPALLTVTANNVTRGPNTPDPAFSATYAGLVNGDTPAGLGNLSYLATDQSNSQAGSYTLTAYGLNDPNYLVTYVPGSVTVTSSNNAPAAAFILSQVVTNQISLPNSVQTISLPTIASNGQFVLQGLISTLNETSPSTQADDVSCLKSSGGLSSTCDGSLTIHGF